MVSIFIKGLQIGINEVEVVERGYEGGILKVMSRGPSVRM
jgi:hypothetical protein